MKKGGIGIASPTVYKFMKICMNVAQNNYPETLYRMFIINVPMLFSIIWTVAKHFVDKKTQNKVVICGSSYKKEL